MGFCEDYLGLKMQGKNDNEVAEGLGVSRRTVTRLKKIYDCYYHIPRYQKNHYGVTEKDFIQGGKLGLERRLILNRVRKGWKVVDAVNTPKRRKRGKKNA